MTKPKICVVKSDFHGKHSTSWGSEWIHYCQAKKLEYKLIDWRVLYAFDEMLNYDIIVWHYSHYSKNEMQFAHNMLQALKAAGCRVFPDIGDSEHFDDKIAQSYLLRGLGISTPRNYPMHSKIAVEQWIKDVGKFPVVAKLRGGSGASNVTLINNVDELRRYAKRMFGVGLDSSPKPIFKIKSNISSAKSISEFFRRLKRAPEFFFAWRNARSRYREQGYVYLQEFIPGVDHDLKIVVVGDRLSFVARSVREGDFRASGGGRLFYDRSLVDKTIINAAFNAANAMGSDCTGFDMIKNPLTGHPVILEVSYGFSHTAQLDAAGYFDREGVWHKEPLNAPQSLLENLVKEFGEI